MKRLNLMTPANQRRATVLAGIIILQALCALFFIGDVIADYRYGEHAGELHFGLEALAALALVGGVIFLMVELRRLLMRMSDMDAGLMVARGQMAEVMASFFDTWRLTHAERDVALMVLKGLDNETIAQVRATAPGTVRAQTTSIYSKSGTNGRTQFVSLFMEELMSGDFSARDPAKDRPAEGTAPVKNLHPE